MIHSVKRWLGPAVPRLAIVLVTLLVYAGSFDGAFVSDDVAAVQNNPLIRTLDGDHLRRIFTSFDGSNYQPLTVLSLALDYRLFGSASSGFHVTNLLFHVLCALLVYTILLRLEASPLSALFAALLWAVHPVQVESVAWISERKNLLSTLLLLGGFRAYLSFSDRPGPVIYLAVLSLYLSAMLGKMTAMVLPALCLAYEVAFRFRLRVRDALASVPLLALAVFIGWYNLAGNRVQGVTWHGGSPWVTALASITVIPRYLGNVFLPTDLAVYYDVPLRGRLLDPAVALGLFVLLACVAFTFWCMARRWRAGFWILWFFIALSPMLNLIPFPVLMQDRYLYVPLAGIVGLLALGCDAAWRRRVPAYAISTLAILAISSSAWLSFRRVEVFDNPETLWGDWVSSVVYLPAERHASTAAVRARLRAPELRDHLRALNSMQAREPESAVLLANQGALAYESGQLALALHRLEAARRQDPDHARILVSLRRALLRADRLEGAERRLRRTTELEPYFAQGWEHLARVRLERRNLEGARQALDRLDRIQPAGSPLGQNWAYLREKLEKLEPQAP